jgi:hypothetical protein
MTCKCGVEMVQRREWLGPDSQAMLGYAFHNVLRCPARHWFNFWKHTPPSDV